MHPSEALIEKLYHSLGARDGDGMAQCYAPDATFSDPVFPALRGPEVGAMWRMLCERATDIRVEASAIGADDQAGSAHWEAWYTFSQTGRKVHNVIDARYTFRDGVIVTHVDQFDLWRWSRQALGPVGTLLGWSPLVRNKVRGQAQKNLARFLGKPA
ncbi:MAG: nuclear transport factor 2 family protein [Polyangiaceae bacterium]